MPTVSWGVCLGRSREGPAGTRPAATDADGPWAPGAQAPGEGGQLSRPRGAGEPCPEGRVCSGQPSEHTAPQRLTPFHPGSPGEGVTSGLRTDRREAPGPASRLLGFYLAEWGLSEPPAEQTHKSTVSASKPCA